MGLIIEDGSGSGRKAAVSDSLRLKVDAVTRREITEISEDKGAAFSFTSTFTTTGGDEEVIAIKNDDSEVLDIDSIMLSSSVAQQWTIFEVTSGTTAGTTLVPFNLNLTSGVTKSNTSFGNAEVTGGISGTNIYVVRTVVDGSAIITPGGDLILGTGDDIAITASAAGVVAVTIIGFWHPV